MTPEQKQLIKLASKYLEEKFVSLDLGESNGLIFGKLATISDSIAIINEKGFCLHSFAVNDVLYWKISFDTMDYNWQLKVTLR